MTQASVGTVLIILVSFMLRYLLQPWLEPFAVFHFFIVACLSVQYFFGIQFALVSVALSVLLGEYFFVKPYGMFGEFSSKDFILTLNFLLVTLTAIAFMEPLRRTLYARDLLLKVVYSRHKISLFRENDRIFYAQKTNQVWSILQELLDDFDQILLIKLGDNEFKLEPLFFKITQNNILQSDSFQWKNFVHQDDWPVLEQIFDRSAPKMGAKKTFDLRFWQTDGSLFPCRLCVNHFHFMGKNLSILKLSQ